MPGDEHPETVVELRTQAIAMIHHHIKVVQMTISGLERERAQLKLAYFRMALQLPFLLNVMS